MCTSIRPLSVELQKVAETELNEVPSRVQEDISAFREWIAKQAHLNGRTDDQHLVSFLRGTKFSLERAKKKYDLFYTVRTALPEIFKNRDPKSEKILYLIKKGLVLPLRETVSPGSARIFLIRMTLYNPDEYSINDVLKIFNMMGDLCLLTDDNYVMSGQISFVDCSGATLSHLGQWSPRFAKNAMMIFQESSPIRMKGVHYVNTPTGFQTVFNIFKSMMNEKNKQRLHVHGSDLNVIHKFIPKNLLPVEYGGDDGTVQDLINYWEGKYIEHRDYLMDFESFGTDETKRVGQPKYVESLFGTEGSFRRLEVD